MKEIIITPEIAGQRLDKFLARHLGAAPKAFIHKMLRKKNIVVNNKRSDGGQIIAAGDVVRLYLADDTVEKFTKAAPQAAPGPLDIVYEDENIIIINKTANLLTQPDAAMADSLTGRLRHHFSNSTFAPVCVNRLDRNTTGIVLCAKNLAAAQVLSKLIHDRAIGKYYLAAVHGQITGKMRLEGTHTKDEAKNLAKIVPRGTLEGTEAVTLVFPIHYNAAKDITTLKIDLQTGRSHQIRAHLASIGHPIVGDAKYGGKKAPRQMLHAHEVAFGQIAGVLGYLSGKNFIAPMPNDMKIWYDLDKMGRE
ncbi:MAG: RluA family pseudouridine synthase [Defluviitaleaceae bacterium]|nr:RluA family pseudouridine synthase [Defluviitaleaceae bacterium]